MKENKYDDDVFFNKYKEMNRSVQGLEGAGEWSQLKQLLPDFEGKRVLDLGCGYGWHCIYAAQQKAASVHGVDISKKMLAVAEEKAEITLSPIKQCNGGSAIFQGILDVVISSLAFHYVKDFKQLAAAISTWLTPKRKLCLLG